MPIYIYMVNFLCSMVAKDSKRRS